MNGRCRDRRSAAASALICLILLTLSCAAGCGTATRTGADLTTPTDPAALWPCSIFPSQTLARFGLQIMPSSPRGGTTQGSVPICESYDSATTLGAVLSTGKGNPAFGTTKDDAPGIGDVYVRDISVPIDAAAVTLAVPAKTSSQIDEFWTVAVTCRVGCDDASALRVAEALAASIEPRAAELFERQPAGARYWTPGGSNAASASVGTVPAKAVPASTP